MCAEKEWKGNGEQNRFRKETHHRLAFAFTEHSPLANNNCIEVSHITTSRTAQLTENKQNVPHEVSHATVGTASLDPAAC
jgi:hypothetical protein